MSEEETPSRTQTNKMIRVLTGRHQKYTITVHRKDGTTTEWQSHETVGVHWNDAARQLWLKGSNYGSPDIMPYEEGMVILCEENPDWVEKKK